MVEFSLKGRHWLDFQVVSGGGIKKLTYAEKSSDEKNMGSSDERITMSFTN